MNACYRSRVLAQARGYIGHLEWLERMSKSHTQHKCPKCQLFHIFKQKQRKPVADSETNEVKP